MKRLLSPLIGLLVLLAPLPASAGAIGDMAPVAVSPAVRQVLDRTQQGIDRSKQADPIFTFFDWMLPEWWSLVMTDILRTDAEITLTARGLQDMTACRRVDLFLLEEAMEEIRKNLQPALKDKNIKTILGLTQLQRYVSARYTVLAEKGNDPQGKDPNFWTAQTFDPQGYEASTEPVCYFTTDYVPPVITQERYGCDASVMDSIIAGLQSVPDATRVEALLASIKLERDAQSKIETTILNSISSTNTLLAVQQHLDQLGGSTTTATSSAPNDQQNSGERLGREHRVESGCLKRLPDGVWLRAKTGPFTTDVNDSEILTWFRGLWRSASAKRAIPRVLRDMIERASPATQSLIEQGRDRVDADSRLQGERDSAIYATGIDPLLTMQEVLRNFTVSVGRLSTLAKTKETGLRGFVRDFVFFLQRSCIDRTCRAKLDAIQNIVNADECFPFTNGEYLTATSDNSSKKQCLDAAGLTNL